MSPGAVMAAFISPPFPHCGLNIEYQVSLQPLCGLDSCQASCEVCSRRSHLRDVLKLGGRGRPPSPLSAAQHRVRACPATPVATQELKGVDDEH